MNNSSDEERSRLWAAVWANKYCDLIAKNWARHEAIIEAKLFADKAMVAWDKVIEDY